MDLGEGKNRMGGSMLAQVLNQFGNEVPDCDSPEMLKAAVNAVNACVHKASCWPTTTVVTAACGRPWLKWLCWQHWREPERGHAGDRGHRRGRQPR